MLIVNVVSEGIELMPFFLKCKNLCTIGEVKEKIADIIGLKNYLRELEFIGILKYGVNNQNLNKYIPHGLNIACNGDYCLLVGVKIPKSLNEKVNVKLKYEINKCDRKLTWAQKTVGEYVNVEKIWRNSYNLDKQHLITINKFIVTKLLNYSELFVKPYMRKWIEIMQNPMEIFRDENDQNGNPIVNFPSRKVIRLMCLLLTTIISSKFTIFDNAYYTMNSLISYTFLQMFFAFFLFVLIYDYLIVLESSFHHLWTNGIGNRFYFNVYGNAFMFAIRVIGGFVASLFPNTLD